MNGILHDEGRLIVLLALAQKSNPDRGAAGNVELRLFVNPATRTKATGFTDFVEPAGGGYSPITLTPAQAAVAGTSWTFPPQTFTAVGTNYSTPVRGWFLVTTGTARRVLASEEFDGGPVQLNVGMSQQITPQYDINLPA